MPVTALPLTNGFYQSDSLPLSAQECLGCYVNIPDAPALNDRSIFSMPGLTQIATAGATSAYACRGEWNFRGTPYFVLGDTLYSMNSSGTLTGLGTISGTGRVSMAADGTNLVILVPGSTGYVYTTGGGLVTISDADFTANGNPLAVTYLDGYFIFTTDDDKFIVSALSDPTSYDALDFSSTITAADNSKVPVVYKGQLFIVGRTTCEGFTNIGGAGFPFQRSGLFLNKGAKSSFSATRGQDTFCFIGGEQNEMMAVWAFADNGLKKISTKAIDNLLADVDDADIGSVVGWNYGQDGHYFTGWTLPTTAIVYDWQTGLWHERRSRYEDTDTSIVETTYRCSGFIYAHSRIYAGDLLTGNVGIVSQDVYTEYGENIMRRFSTQPFMDNMKPFFVPSLELTVESGVGNLGEPEPQIRLDRSTDGGKTWSYERARSMGAVGEYDKRCVWRRNGRVGRFDIYRFTTTAPVKFAALALTANLELSP